MVVPTGDHMGTAWQPKETLDTRIAGKVAFQAPRTTAVGDLGLYSIYTASIDLAQLLNREVTGFKKTDSRPTGNAEL